MFARHAILYSICYRFTDDFEIEIVPMSKSSPRAGLLRWRVGLRPDSPVRSRGVTMMATPENLLSALRDARLFFRRNLYEHRAWARRWSRSYVPRASERRGP